MLTRTRKQSRFERRGAAVAFTAVTSTVLLGFVALTVDVGMLYNVRAELQRTADAGAMAGAWRLLDSSRLAGGTQLNTVLAASRTEASRVSGMNPVQGNSLAVDFDADITLGYLANPSDLTSQLVTNDPMKFNTVVVDVHRDATRNGPVELWFARIFGINSTNMQAHAAATFRDGVVGFKIDGTNGSNVQLLPFALHIDIWKQLLAGTRTTGDIYKYDSETKLVSTASDGVNELNLYPGAGGTQLPPGNFGTVDIGSANNSTSDICRQIRYGVSKEDFDAIGGELKLGADGTVLLNGDTGLSAGFKDDLEAIKGQPRIIPLFNNVAGNGNNSMFTIVGFAGIRIVNVKLTGAMNQKQVIIQPALVADPGAITSPTQTNSYYAYEPVHLTR